MSQVIIISNRLPISVKKQNGKLEFYASIGGLATGLASYVGRRHSSWIGWPGIASDELTDDDKQKIVRELAKHNYSPVWLTQRQIDEFYNGYSNSVIWPVYHTLRRGKPDQNEKRRWWQAYRQVNRLFAEAAINFAETGARVWVHDYQLQLMPEMLRAERVDLTIGFFMHIPFPGSSKFGEIPEAKKLLNGVLGADLVGFHTPGYVANFLDSCQAAGILVLENNMPLIHDRQVRVADFPMGIDYDKYAAADKSEAVRKAIDKYRSLYKGKKVIVAVDRLDPSKGLVQRLNAYRMFLEKYPERHGKVVFSMVVAPSRTDVPAYKRLSRRLSNLAEEINQTYGTADWQPVDYIDHAVPFEEVTALFRIADVAFITPLKDGMNLAAKEFVASAHKNGVLILSETAGASAELQDALIVNPRQPETLVEALNHALSMRRRELRRRLRRMQNQLASHTVHSWARDFVVTLQKPVPGTPIRTRGLRERTRKSLFKDYRAARKRLLLLDYDGSLVPFSEDYREATPPKSLINLVQNLANDEANDIVVISGRSAEDLDNWFGKLPVSLVAEHGAAIKKPDSDNWQTTKADTAWKQLLKPSLQKYAKLAPGAKIEEKPHSLVWHYRSVAPYYAQKYTVIIKRVFRPIVKEYGLELLQGNKALEIKNPKIGKDVAAQKWLKKNYGIILAIGDDVTDEDLFAILPYEAYSIKVGRGRTAARFRVTSHKEVLDLLRKLSKA